MPSRNLQLLSDAARLLKPMLEDLVFVGGCVTALLITDKASAQVRPTPTSTRSGTAFPGTESRGILKLGGRFTRGSVRL